MRWCWALLLLPTLAFAQTPPRVTQEVVVTATIEPISPELLGRSVTVLTRDDLQALGATSVVRLSVTLDRRERVDGQRYWLLDARVSRAVKRASLYLDVSNLLDETYREVAGVAMPGRWITAGVAFR